VTVSFDNYKSEHPTYIEDEDDEDVDYEFPEKTAWGRNFTLFCT